MLFIQDFILFQRLSKGAIAHLVLVFFVPDIIIISKLLTHTIHWFFCFSEENWPAGDDSSEQQFATFFLCLTIRWH